MKNKLVGVVGMAMVMGSVNALAEPTREPMERALERLNRNIARNPDNAGLQNASERLGINRERQLTRGKNQAPGQQRLDGPRSMQAVPRAERAESPARPERPEVAARPERPEVPARPEHPARPERPEPPGHARR